MTVPNAVSEYLQGMLCGARSLSWLIVNRDGNLLETGGDIGAHGIGLMSPRDHVTDSVPFLRGLLPADSTPFVLNAIEVVPNRFSDLHIFTDGERDWILLLSCTQEETIRRETENALRTSEIRLRQALRMETLGRLAAGVAHDFNNLLTVITGNSQRLLDSLPPDDPIRMSATQINTAATSAGRLTSQLLAFSRMQMVRPRVLDLNTIVTELANILQRLIGENIRLETHLDPTLALIKADAGKIEQVIVNLAVNSRDAMVNGGQLTIKTANVETDAGPTVMLSIIDTGCGMDHETQTQMFEPFFTTKDTSKGTGLGLAIVDEIVKQSGGSIAVESEPEQGTAFHLSLPATSETKEFESAASQASGARSDCERILLVENEDSVREFVACLLTRSGFEVLQAAESQEALRIEQHEARPIHMLIADIRLPGLPGNELAALLRARRPQIPVLYISGSAPEPDALEPGSWFLPKPFTLETLVAKVHEVTEATSGGGRSAQSRCTNERRTRT